MNVNYNLPSAIEEEVISLLENWQRQNYPSRLWQHDYTLWKERIEDDVELSNRLGWLDLPYTMIDSVDEINSFVKSAKKFFSNVLVLGMGGSSLAPEVFSKTFGSKKGFPKLEIVDSTHPENLKAILKRIKISKTLFLVASKSGGTAETMSFFHFFWNEVERINSNPGEQFVALTDADSGLEKLAKEKKFRKIFTTPSEVGGRFSALTQYGMLPAALIGINIKKFLNEARKIAHLNDRETFTLKNPSFYLGASLGTLASHSKNKLTFVVSKKINSFPDWIEQLIAESTGKEEKGILPIANEPLLSADYYGSDRVFVQIRLRGDKNFSADKFISKIGAEGFPTITIQLNNLYELAQEFYKWEVATAIAGAVLKLNPFDQPDVQLAKTLANESLAEYKQKGKLPSPAPNFIEKGIEVFSGGSEIKLKNVFVKFFSEIPEGSFVSILCFTEYSKKTEREISKLRAQLLKKYKVATTFGYGPRFLHSTGQYHKGGTNQGFFIQITNRIKNDVDVPTQTYSFGTLITAQAQGDKKALLNKHRKVLHLNLQKDAAEQLNYILSLLK